MYMRALCFDYSSCALLYTCWCVSVHTLYVQRVFLTQIKFCNICLSFKSCCVFMCVLTSDRTNLDTKSWYGKCKKSVDSARWLCYCGTSWFRYARHQGVPKAERRRKVCVQDGRKKTAKRKQQEGGKEAAIPEPSYQKRNVNFSTQACEEAVSEE